jgi:hypothetical protein
MRLCGRGREHGRSYEYPKDSAFHASPSKVNTCEIPGTRLKRTCQVLAATANTHISELVGALSLPLRFSYLAARPRVETPSQQSALARNLWPTARRRESVRVSAGPVVIEAFAIFELSAAEGS